MNELDFGLQMRTPSRIGGSCLQNTTHPARRRAWKITKHHVSFFGGYLLFGVVAVPDGNHVLWRVSDFETEPSLLAWPSRLFTCGRLHFRSREGCRRRACDVGSTGSQPRRRGNELVPGKHSKMLQIDQTQHMLFSRGFIRGTSKLLVSRIINTRECCFDGTLFQS